MRIGVSSCVCTDFHDITSGTSGSYSAVTGYDLVTGWGSPNGHNLINALAPAIDNSCLLAERARPRIVTAREHRNVHHHRDRYRRL